MNRQTRKTAQKLFKLCLKPEGGIDDTRVHAVCEYMQSASLRNPVAVLTRFKKLIALELADFTAVVESPQSLSDEEKNTLVPKLQKAFSPNTTIQFKESPNLLGGLRITRGSSVWDGSVRGRLQTLEKNFN